MVVLYLIGCVINNDLDGVLKAFEELTPLTPSLETWLSENIAVTEQYIGKSVE